MVEEILPAVAQVGFPIAVAAYTLVRLEGSLKENTTALIELSKQIGELTKR